jgi:hypothetical protein
VTRVLLIDIGADTLPVVTPVPAQLGTWMPRVYVMPALSVPGGFALTPVLDGVLLTWNTIAEEPALYIIERAPDVAGAPGAWTFVGSTPDPRYTATVAGGVTYWWRVKAEVYARRSAATAALKGVPGTIGGSGTNILPDPYSTFESTVLPQIGNPNGIGLARDAAIKMFAASLRLSGGTGTVWLSPNAFNIQLTPGKKYLLSFWVRSGAALASLQPFIEVAESVFHYGAVQSTAAANVFERKSVVLDLSANTALTGHVGFSKINAGDYLLDGIMVEELVGTTNIPSAYTRGRADGVALAALVAAQSAQATADGQIDIYRQANAPSIGGAGAKLGDYWQDSDDGRWWYCNGSSWVESPDNRLPQAVLDAAAANSAAAGAQNTANARIRLFVQEAQPSGGTYIVGDQWFKASTAETRYWNGSGWSILATINTSDSNGKHLVRNRNFSARLMGNRYATSGVGHFIVDDWKVQNDNVRWSLILEPGQNTVLFRINGGMNLANGAQAVATLQSTKFQVTPSEKINFGLRASTAWLSVPPAGITTLIRVYINFYDGAGNYISQDFTDVGRVALATSSFKDVTVPSNAVSAEMFLQGMLTNTSGAAWVSGSLPYDARVERVGCLPKSNLDTEVEHGTVYGRTSNEDLWDTGAFGYARRIGLNVKGSRKILGGARNARASLVYGIAAVRTTGALTANSSGQVTVNAHSVEISGETVTYSTVTNAITGLAQNQTYVIFTLDPFLDGGARTYYAQTSVLSAQQAGEGAVFIGNITIPASGSSGGGGGGGGNPGEWCVDADMLLPNGQRAGDVQPEDLVLCWDENAAQPGDHLVRATSNAIAPARPSTRIVTTSGAAVVASDCTPMPLRDSNDLVCITDMLGREALVRDAAGQLAWERVIECTSVGLRDVAFLRVQQQCYFAGETTDRAIATHNPTYKP